MNALEQVLSLFEQPDVEEIVLESGKSAEGLTGGAQKRLGTVVWDTDAILSALVSFGGSRHVEELCETPRQWTARAAGVGLVSVSALQDRSRVEARFRRAKRVSKSLRPRAKTPPPFALDTSTAPRTAPTTKLPAERTIPTAPHGPPLEAFELASPFDGLESGPSLELDTRPHAPLSSLEMPPLPPLRPAAPAPPPPLPPLPPAAAARPEPAVPAPPPVASLESLLASAREARASDLHIVAGRPPLYRIAGELRVHGIPVSPEQVEKMILPRVPERLASMLKEQGSCDFALIDRTHGRFRVNVSRQQTGYKACLRLVSKELPTVESLGLPEGIAAGAHHHQGLIIFTGPTGHGKTTTMNAVIDLINRSTSHHIITVEDPVEHLHPKKKALMSQREVGTHTRSFASALKGSLREDPDVIAVGELRDVETVRMAVSASETGHLVLGTMNTPSAARTLDRLIDLFPPGDQPQIRLTLAAGLRLIVSQRLVPGKDGKSMHAAFEVLPGSVPLSALIRDNKTFQIPSLQQRGKGLGIVRLDESLAKLVADDKVTLEVAKSVCESPTELDTFIKALRGPGR